MEFVIDMHLTDHRAGSGILVDRTAGHRQIVRPSLLLAGGKREAVGHARPVIVGGRDRQSRLPTSSLSGVPEKVRLSASKLSQAGSAEPNASGGSPVVDPACSLEQLRFRPL